MGKGLDVSSALDRLKDLTSKLSGYEVARKENMKLLETLYHELGIDAKVPYFYDLFDFKAINLSGVTLTPDALGEIKEGKYVQIIAIRYDASSAVKNRNSSLGYYGRADRIDRELLRFLTNFWGKTRHSGISHY